MHTATPWRVVWKHDTHKVKRDKEGHIVGPVTVPFEDYVHALECVNAHAALVEALEHILVWDDGNLPGDILDDARNALTLAKEGA